MPKLEEITVLRGGSRVCRRSPRLHVHDPERPFFYAAADVVYGDQSPRAMRPTILTASRQVGFFFRGPAAVEIRGMTRNPLATLSQ